jgi:hypothetical protein
LQKSGVDVKEQNKQPTAAQNPPEPILPIKMQFTGMIDLSPIEVKMTPLNLLEHIQIIISSTFLFPLSWCTYWSFHFSNTILKVARQITLIEQQLFKAIKPYELQNQCWTKSDKYEKAPNVMNMINHATRVQNSLSVHLLTCISLSHKTKIEWFVVEQISMWVVTEIMKHETVTKRAECCKRFIDVALVSLFLSLCHSQTVLFSTLFSCWILLFWIGVSKNLEFQCSNGDYWWIRQCSHHSFETYLEGMEFVTYSYPHSHSHSLIRYNILSSFHIFTFRKWIVKNLQS